MLGFRNFQEKTLETIPVTVTKFSRNLSAFLDRVQHQGQTSEIKRGEQVITRVIPVTSGFPIDKPDDFLTSWPQFSADRKSMPEGVKNVQTKLRG